MCVCVCVCVCVCACARVCSHVLQPVLQVMHPIRQTTRQTQMSTAPPPAPAAMNTWYGGVGWVVGGGDVREGDGEGDGEEDGGSIVAAEEREGGQTIFTHTIMNAQTTIHTHARMCTCTHRHFS